MTNGVGGRIDHANARLVAGLVDVSEQRAAEARIHRLAFYDPLTGLANRRLLRDRLEQGLARYRRTAAHAAVLFVDLDHFKALNDSRGHAAGDELLVAVADRLRQRLRESDTVARIGGDEFVILLNGLGIPRPDALAQALQVAEEVRDLLDQPFQLAHFNRENPDSSVDPHVAHITSSIGVVLLDQTDINVDEALRRADVAMYQAKSAGRNTLQLYEQGGRSVSAISPSSPHYLG